MEVLFKQPPGLLELTFSLEHRSTTCNRTNRAGIHCERLLEGLTRLAPSTPADQQPAQFDPEAPMRRVVFKALAIAALCLCVPTPKTLYSSEIREGFHHFGVAHQRSLKRRFRIRQASSSQVCGP